MYMYYRRSTCSVVLSDLMCVGGNIAPKGFKTSKSNTHRSIKRYNWGQSRQTKPYDPGSRCCFFKLCSSCSSPSQPLEYGPNQSLPFLQPMNPPRPSRRPRQLSLSPGTTSTTPSTLPINTSRLPSKQPRRVGLD